MAERLQLRRPRAPAGRFLVAGALVLLGMQTGCGEGLGGGADEGPRVLELVNDTIHLEPGVRLHDIGVRREASGDFEPAELEANVGDFVRFTAHDRGGHALVFEGPALSAPARAFLNSSGQLRSPPLITDSAAWVISLKGAPSGEYPYHCTTHALAGRLVVRAKAP